MKDKSVDEIVAGLMELPKLLLERTERNEKAIRDLVEHQKLVMNLIFKLHDIDPEKLRSCE